MARQFQWLLTRQDQRLNALLVKSDPCWRLPALPRDFPVPPAEHPSSHHCSPSSSGHHLCCLNLPAQLLPLKVTWMLREDLDLHGMASAGDRCKPCPCVTNTPLSTSPGAPSCHLLSPPATSAARVACAGSGLISMREQGAAADLPSAVEGSPQSWQI